MKLIALHKKWQETLPDEVNGLTKEKHSRGCIVINKNKNGE
tara:strand:+ start:39 stop:161 length:123 start_codon:yes stop_codon:yes gene_type:complete